MLTCIRCSGRMLRGRTKFCGRLCHAAWRRLQPHKPSKCSDGRIRLHSPGHPYADHHGYVFEYRLVVEESLGRFLLPSEHVHHKNGDPCDNRIENLEVIAAREHAIRHVVERAEKKGFDWHTQHRCVACGRIGDRSEFSKGNGDLRSRCKPCERVARLARKPLRGMPDQRGGKNPASKLKESDIREIRMLRDSGWALGKIAQHFGVGCTSVSSIVRRIRWGHVL